MKVLECLVGDLVLMSNPDNTLNDDKYYVYVGYPRGFLEINHQCKRMRWVQTLYDDGHLFPQTYTRTSPRWRDKLLEFFLIHGYDPRCVLLYASAYVGRYAFLEELPALIPSRNNTVTGPYRDRAKSVLRNARLGDILMYRNPHDVVSVMVAKLFRGPWSNCGIVDENFSLVELRPAGVLQLPLEYYAGAKFDMGLYRIIGEADFGKLAEVVNASLFSRMQTSYGAVMATACKTQQLKYSEPETNPMDLVYAGNLRLIAHT